MIRVAETGVAVGGEFNLGTGSDISIGDLVRRLIMQTAGVSYEVLSDGSGQRPADSEVSRLCSDNSKSRQVRASTLYEEDFYQWANRDGRTGNRAFAWA